MFQFLKTPLKYTLTLPQVLIHKIRGVDEKYSDLVTFFRYIPGGWINKDRTVSFLFQGKIVNMYYADLQPISACGTFKNGEYDDLNVKGKTVIDVGAAHGDTPVYFSLKGADKVYGYEINKRFFDMAVRNVEHNTEKSKIELNYCGVASKKVNSKDTILGACVPEQDRAAVDQADFKTLDEIVSEKHVSGGVLKVDVDGFEYEIFRNTNVLTLQKFDQIFLEYHYGIQDLGKILTNAGFTFTNKIANVLSIPHHPEEYRNMEVGYLFAQRTK
jgi:FkbM family methyltransferase